MLSGRVPSKARATSDIMTAHVKTKPKRFSAPGVKDDVVDLIMHAREEADDRPRMVRRSSISSGRVRAR